MKATPSNAYTEFDRRFLHASSWAERKDGVPLELLDNLSQKRNKPPRTHSFADSPLATIGRHVAWVIFDRRKL
jgi:hypothetical protein